DGRPRLVLRQVGGPGRVRERRGAASKAIDLPGMFLGAREAVCLRAVDDLNCENPPRGKLGTPGGWCAGSRAPFSRPLVPIDSKKGSTYGLPDDLPCRAGDFLALLLHGLAAGRGCRRRYRIGTAAGALLAHGVFSLSKDGE